MSEFSSWLWRQLITGLLVTGAFIGASFLPLRPVQHYVLYALLLAAAMFCFGNLTLKGYVKGIVSLALFLALIHFLGWLGIIGAILAAICVLAYFPIFRHKQYMGMLHNVETMIYGQPLYKYKEQGKPIPRIRFKL